MQARNTKSKIVKFFVLFVLFWFLLFMIMSAVFTYMPQNKTDIEAAKTACESDWLIRDDEQNLCVEELEENIQTEENCLAQSGTRYAENGVCIK